MPQNNAPELTNLTRRLIDIPSVSRQEEPLLEFVLEAMPPFLELAYRGDAVALLTTPLRSDRELVILAGHTDTVPITQNVPSHLSGNTIFGRGASDMKGGLAVMIEAAQWISDTSPALDFDLGWLFFGREELPPAFNALIPALEASSTLRSAAFAVLFEPTSNAVEAGCQGNLNLTLTYAGVAAHSARPWAGVNAIHRSITDLHELATAEPVDVDIDGLTFREVATVTGVRGGTARNVLPDSVEVDLNIRYSPARSPAEVEKHWRSRFERDDVEVEVVGHAVPAPVVVDHPLTRRLLDAGASAALPKQAWTNIADFAAHGVPAINFGPGDPFYAHREDEQISIDELERSLSVLQRFIAGPL